MRALAEADLALTLTGMSEASERLQAAVAERYQIEREVGAGGMAIVYLAEDLKHHRYASVSYSSQWRCSLKEDLCV